MRLYLIYILILISNLGAAQISVDTITNWQIYKDSELILAGSVVMENVMLSIKSINLQDKFDNIKIDFFYDFYSGNIEREIGFYIDNKQIGEFKNNDSARESINIPKDLKII